MNILFKNAKVYTEKAIIENGIVFCKNGLIELVEEANNLINYPSIDIEIDVKGNKLLPGFIDVHVHGCGGFDAMSGELDQVIGMSQFLAKSGTTSFLATTLTADQKTIQNAIRSIVFCMEMKTTGAQLVGIHLEGPFINKKRCGAQNPDFIRNPSISELSNYVSLAKNHVKLITLAPEKDGSTELINYAVDNGITVSIGHSDATFQVVKEAVLHGATHITHLFNGMSPIHHREPGVAGTALILNELAVELICDGFHIGKEMIDFVFKVKPIDKIILITDSVSAAGLPDGDQYMLGGLNCYMKNGQIRLKSSHDLAGSCLTMDQSLRNAIQYTNLPLEVILPTMTINPARQIGIDHQKGSIQVGKDADLVILNENNEVVATYVKGDNVFSSNELF